MPISGQLEVDFAVEEAQRCCFGNFIPGNPRNLTSRNPINLIPKNLEISLLKITPTGFAMFSSLRYWPLLCCVVYSAVYPILRGNR